MLRTRPPAKQVASKQKVCHVCQEPAPDSTRFRNDRIRCSECETKQMMEVAAVNQKRSIEATKTRIALRKWKAEGGAVAPNIRAWCYVPTTGRKRFQAWTITKWVDVCWLKMQSTLFLMHSLGIESITQKDTKKPHTKIIQKLQRQNEPAGGQIHLIDSTSRWGVSWKSPSTPHNIKFQLFVPAEIVTSFRQVLLCKHCTYT